MSDHEMRIVTSTARMKCFLSIPVKFLFFLFANENLNKNLFANATKTDKKPFLTMNLS